MKILCFGDSNTYGYDPCVPFGGRYPAEQRWVDLLAAKLGCVCINAGENGREIPRRDWEFRYFDQLLKTHGPVDYAVIMLGGNDLFQGNSVETVVQRMEHFLKSIALERSKILLLAPPPMQFGEWVFTQEMIDKSLALCRAYKALAERLNVLFADAGTWDIPLAFDGAHFTEEGHRAFAEGLTKQLSKGD